MNLNQKNTKKQGDVGLGIAVGYFASQGITVSLPLTDSQDYDLVVDVEGELKRVQVKTSRHSPKNNGKYQVGLRTLGGNRSWSGVCKKFDPTKVDLLFVLTADDKKYLIPSDCIKAKSAIMVGGEAYKEFIVAF